MLHAHRLHARRRGELRGDVQAEAEPPRIVPRHENPEFADEPADAFAKRRICRTFGAKRLGHRALRLRHGTVRRPQRLMRSPATRLGRLRLLALVLRMFLKIQRQHSEQHKTRIHRPRNRRGAIRKRGGLPSRVPAQSVKVREPQLAMRKHAQARPVGIRKRRIGRRACGHTPRPLHPRTLGSRQCRPHHGSGILLDAEGRLVLGASLREVVRERPKGVDVTRSRIRRHRRERLPRMTFSAFQRRLQTHAPTFCAGERRLAMAGRRLGARHRSLTVLS